MRLISAEAFKTYLEKKYGWGALAKAICKDIDNQQTIPPVSNRHGHWIESCFVNKMHKCSVCGDCIPYVIGYDGDSEWLEEIALTKYCPNCGATMDEPMVIIEREEEYKE